MLLPELHALLFQGTINLALVYEDGGGDAKERCFLEILSFGQRFFSTDASLSKRLSTLKVYRVTKFPFVKLHFSSIKIRMNH